ncbi:MULTISPECIES: ATP-binding protein [unclassified Streptomyces]|uniref:ATP-binding protein n=1 Tax=unclassified Streptomyces TaxID=2593676 RepID=UPI001BE5A028|nr:MULTISPECIES: ATP-binding protein [unclassified Streptomyces]MBT2406830.1 ATP-binding protein [Streptomyces sp. ISL-21]MBT2612162.1 ATP-binding protein [Streptomyces sp. ISL-87]
MNHQLAQTWASARQFDVQLSATPRGARLARLLAVEQLRGWGLPFDRAAHVIAELAANAVTHGKVPGRDFRLALAVTRSTLRIEVTDTRGDRTPGVREAVETDEFGRGLLLVEALADRWGVTNGPAPRKVVWAEISVSTGSRISATRCAER